ncbi:hypothetical protein HYQ46_012405 [Verticillium longisporum]|nr:hypothetical protein HYQ46_012405 [Verticillium longisporum]
MYLLLNALVSVVHAVIVKVKESQDGRGDSIAIVLKMARFRSTVRMIQVLDGSHVHPHLNLALDHVVVKGKMRLRREQAVGDIEALDSCMTGGAPDRDL